jgi:hypothetical protein
VDPEILAARERAREIADIQRGTAQKAAYYKNELRQRLAGKKSASLMRKMGYTYGARERPPYKMASKRDFARGKLVQPQGFRYTSGPLASATIHDMTKTPHPNWVKVKTAPIPRTFYNARPRYPPMRSQQGPARRRDPIRINDNILRAEEDARARWGWYRAEDVYVTT